MIGSFVCRAYMAILLVFGIACFSILISRIPAFDPNARLLGVEGAWDVADRTAHYDQARYLYHLGYAYLGEPEFFFDPETGNMQLVDPEELLERTVQAETLLRASIDLDPANAHVWAALAQAQIALGETDTARASLERSWALGPNSLHMASIRLAVVADIIDQLGDGDLQPGLLFDGEVEHARMDIEMMQRFEPEELERLLEDASQIAKLKEPINS